MLPDPGNMTSGAAKLVRDGTLLLVAERFLQTLEASIRDAHSIRGRLDNSFFQKGACYGDYMDIRGLLEMRNLQWIPISWNSWLIFLSGG